MGSAGFTPTPTPAAAAVINSARMRNGPLIRGSHLLSCYTWITRSACAIAIDFFLLGFDFFFPFGLLFDKGCLNSFALASGGEGWV